ncbi:MAG TPA: hypothetical protein VLI92_01215 [Candidatus Saccharimonadales bacterium]|nr:hypothetical protein [Candidatus Saccharimonadales bacterium]
MSIKPWWETIGRDYEGRYRWLTRRKLIGELLIQVRGSLLKGATSFDIVDTPEPWLATVKITKPFQILGRTLFVQTYKLIVEIQGARIIGVNGSIYMMQVRWTSYHLNSRPSNPDYRENEFTIKRY